MDKLYPYEKLVVAAEKMGAEVYELPFNHLHGLYHDGLIGINAGLSQPEKNCVLAEEIGHMQENTGDITDQRILTNRKQERLGRANAYRRLLPPRRLVDAYLHGCANPFEVAEYLDVTEHFLYEAIHYYHQLFGLSIRESGYVIALSDRGYHVQKSKSEKTASGTQNRVG